MTRSPRRLTALAVCWAVSGCASTPSAPPQPPAPPPLSQSEIDGIYRGTSTRYQADARACPSPGLVLLRVVGGAFQYRWNGRTKVDGTITPDGVLQGGYGDISLSGHLAADKIEGDAQSPSCAYHFRASKRPH